MTIAGLTTLDLVALIWFVALWFAYAQLVDRPIWPRASINRAMHRHRHAWMRQMVRRENRITDSSLIGHVMHSVSFFASTTIIVVAALLSALRAIEDVRAVVAELPFAYVAPVSAWHVKVLILIGLFVYAFFKFTWSIRQWNYCCVLIGTAPPAPVAEAEAEAVAERAARVASAASLNFNAGLRAYYFALGMLAWFVHPLAFMITTLWVLGVLAWRQFRSPSAEAIVPANFQSTEQQEIR